MRLIFLLITFIFLLAGCSAESMYGFSQDSWEKLPAEQQQKIKLGYNKVHEKLEEERFYQKPPKPGAEQVRVAVYAGTALMPPFKHSYRYDRETVTVTDGSCESVILHQLNGDHKTVLGLCYNNKLLQVDPSQYELEKRHGTVALHLSPIWKRGFTYKHVTTSGYARLNNAHIYVLAVS